MTLGGLSLLVWFYLLVFHHRFWRADQRLDTPQILPDWPPVTVIVPARNEAATIAACVKSLLNQDYPGTLSIIIVDDSSTDGTGDIAHQ